MPDCVVTSVIHILHVFSRVASYNCALKLTSVVTWFYGQGKSGNFQKSWKVRENGKGQGKVGEYKKIPHCKNQNLFKNN